MADFPNIKNSNPGDDPAVAMIRSKIDTIHAAEPSAKEEIQEVTQATHLSKHQKYMKDLSTSGKSLAEIQTAWHEYYAQLPDHEKHEVWQEFYAEHEKKRSHPDRPEGEPQKPHTKAPPAPKSMAALKKQILGDVSAKKLSKKQHLKSLLFGLSMGAVMFVFVLFGFFNERFITPFITPSRTVSSTPIIIDPNNSAVGRESKIIIPKINVEVPVVYDVNTINENDIQKGLERGVVHYSTTPNPGELGNSVIVGHSSNNLLNPGKYKFAFVMLKQLNEGDTFMLNKDGKQYVYKIFEKKIVKPNDVSVLGPNSKPATATLITCDPPGTSINRLIVVGEQISPSPSKNKQSSVVPDTSQTQVVPGNAPSLWSRFWNWLAH